MTSFTNPLYSEGDLGEAGNNGFGDEATSAYQEVFDAGGAGLGDYQVPRNDPVYEGGYMSVTPNSLATAGTGGADESGYMSITPNTLPAAADYDLPRGVEALPDEYMDVAGTEA